MKILFLGVGKTKQGFLTEGIERYKKLLIADAKISEKYIREEDDTRPGSVEKESAALLKNIPSGYYRILLDIGGRKLSSEEFSRCIREVRDGSAQGAVFIVGGSRGVSEELGKTADIRLSFSDMTFTHQMIRLILAEQIYRAFSIMNNRTYHK